MAVREHADRTVGREIAMLLFVMFLRQKPWKILIGGILPIEVGVAIVVIRHGIAGNRENHEVIA